MGSSLSNTKLRQRYKKHLQQTTIKDLVQINFLAVEKLQKQFASPLKHTLSLIVCQISQ